MGRCSNESGCAEAQRHQSLSDPDERPWSGDRELADDRQRHDEPGVLQRRFHRGRVHGRPGGERLPVHLRGARPRALHDVHALAEYGARARPDRVGEGGEAGRQSPEGRSERAAAHRAHRDRSGRRQGLSVRFVCAARAGGKPPTIQSSQYKLFATQLSQRVCEDALDIQGAAGQIREGQDEGPIEGRFEGAYRATVVETIGGGSSEVQKNIIARRYLGFPKNF